MIKQTPEHRRERNRLRSERWRRAHGIGPRKPAQKPWLEAGCSRSTWYRRRAKTRQEAALAATFTRAERFVAELHADLGKDLKASSTVRGDPCGISGHVLLPIKPVAASAAQCRDNGAATSAW